LPHKRVANRLRGHLGGDSLGNRAASLRRRVILEPANGYGVSTTALYACLHDVVDAIIDKQSEVGPMGFPTTPAELERLASEFQASENDVWL